VLVTLHRPSNVDHPETLQAILAALGEIGQEVPVLFPVHPRTRARITASGLQVAGETVQGGVHLLEPLGYLDFLALQAHASLVLTDSGGIQEETTYLGVPCLTARPNTERPVTVTLGTNRLVKSEYGPLIEALRSGLAGGRSGSTIPPLWDGNAATRILAKIREAGPPGKSQSDCPDRA
jgi:UDP-N-acetylglucosamine 2-epimerase (non-hydrolysing)